MSDAAVARYAFCRAAKVCLFAWSNCSVQTRQLISGISAGSMMARADAVPANLHSTYVG